MNKSILVGLVALGLVACSGGDVNDQPTDAVTTEAPAAEAAPVAEEAAPADAAVVEAPAAEVVDAAPVAQ